MLSLHASPWRIDQPDSGHYRVSCAEPCAVLSFDGYRGQGTIWNISVVGVYAVLPAPFPPVGRTLLLTFVLAGDPMAITCEARVEWHNEPSIFKGCGTTKPTLPPGCGLSFRALDAKDAARIEVRLAAWRGQGATPDGD